MRSTTAGGVIEMTKAFMTAALAALCLGIAGCASQKQPAEEALAAVEAKFKESSAEIQKYLPERYAEIEASIASLRESMSNESYGDVVAEAGQVQQSLKRAIGESRVRRAQTRWRRRCPRWSPPWTRRSARNAAARRRA
jgi:predicted outer membrane protein